MILFRPTTFLHKTKNTKKWQCSWSCFRDGQKTIKKTTTLKHTTTKNPLCLFSSPFILIGTVFFPRLVSPSIFLDPNLRTERPLKEFTRSFGVQDTNSVTHRPLITRLRRKLTSMYTNRRLRYYNWGQQRTLTHSYDFTLVRTVTLICIRLYQNKLSLPTTAVH